jgi:alkylation response protein AidB-like acyl-CoA dehydrogenase
VATERQAAATATELIASARALAPRIAAEGDAIERERRLPQALVDLMVEAGLFRMLVPASLGGPETDLCTFSEVIEIIAAADGSTAWCLGQGAGSAQIAGGLNREASEVIFGDPRTIVAWGPGAGTATLVDGGYRVTGKWPFASGCHHATWMGGTARILNEDGTPRLRLDGSPEVRRMLIPASAPEFFDVWDVSGLRGTGSDTYAVNDLFVPAAFSIPAAITGLPLPDQRYETGALYAFPLGYIYAVAFSSVALGIARGALDAFAELASTKRARGAEGLLREDAVVQSQVARAEAGVRSARALLREAIADTPEAAGPEEQIPVAARAALRLASTHAIHAAAGAVDVVYHAAGATAIFASSGFERRFRDVHAVTQQGQGSQGHFTAVGRYLLGVEATGL